MAARESRSTAPSFLEKFTLEQAMKDQRGSRVLFFL
jgi:hypothetical protein